MIQVDHDWKRSPQYYVFPLWARFGDSMIGVYNSRNPETQLSVYAGQIDGDTYSLLVLNKTAKEYRTRISFDNGFVVTGGTADVVTAKSPSASKVKWNGQANPSDDLVSAPPSNLTQFGGLTRYTFQPYSITLLRLDVE